MSRGARGAATAATSGPRTVVTGAGELVCSYMVQSASGINDFKPMIPRSADLGATWQEQGPILAAPARSLLHFWVGSSRRMARYSISAREPRSIAAANPSGATRPTP